MTTYLYPQNLKATANMWLWSLRDFAIMSIAMLFSVLILANTRMIIPLAVTLCFGFLTIRLEETTVMDFIKYAVKYFISTQQEFHWAERSKKIEKKKQR
ncbi:MAG: hypothetical protein UH239_04365 [Acutalibacteraceae bacterium]|nr:hypothetical protein [Acutalibacteraceae bacterium]